MLMGSFTALPRKWDKLTSLGVSFGLQRARDRKSGHLNSLCGGYCSKSEPPVKVPMVRLVIQNEGDVCPCSDPLESQDNLVYILQTPRRYYLYFLCTQWDMGRKVTLFSSYRKQFNRTPGVKTWYPPVMIKIVTRTGNGTAQIRLRDNHLMNVKSIGNGTNVTHSITTFKR